MSLTTLTMSACSSSNSSSSSSSNSGRSPGRAGDPAGCGHSKLACVLTGLLLTSVQFISVTLVVTKKRNEIFLCRPLKLKFGHAFVISI